MNSLTLKDGMRSVLRALTPPISSRTVVVIGNIARRILARETMKLHPAIVAKGFGMQGSHCFFGYYDVTPFDLAGNRLLAGRREIALGQRAAGTPLELGYFDLRAARTAFIPFGETKTWCWQQGARLQWIESFGQDCVIYNGRVDGRHGSVIKNVESGAILREVPFPINAVHPSERLAISVNLARLQRLRPGYGYDDVPDHSDGLKAPDDDGLWRVDLVNGTRKLLFSLADAARLAPQVSMRDADHYFNHVSWNPSGSRFLVFHLWQLAGRRLGRAITLGRDGKDIFLLTNETRVSHYCWLDDRTILLTSTHRDTGPRFHVYRDQQGLIAVWPREALPVDGHPNLSPTGTWLVCDTLPDLYRERTLFLYNPETFERIDLGDFYTPPKLAGEFRSDLHPRWNHDGTLLCVDASHTGRRTMMTLDISALLNDGIMSA